MLSPEPPKEAIDKAKGSSSSVRQSRETSILTIRTSARRSESEVGGQRSDTIMVLRIDPRQSARRSCRSARRPVGVDRRHGHKQRINTAFSRGPDVLVATLQQNFGIPIQHFVEVDFAGFKGLVDAVGGVPVYFEPRTRQDTGLNIRVSGRVNLNGDQGLAYAHGRGTTIQGRQQSGAPTARATSAGSAASRTSSGAR